MGRGMGTVCPTVREEHGEFLQRELTNARGAQGGLCSPPELGGGAAGTPKA